MSENFEGHSPRECGEHRTVGAHRAWCHDDGEWCYPDSPCRGCERHDVVLVLTLHDHDVVEIWQREGRSGAELAQILRDIADGFERGDPKRIR